jgi:glycosyltransferase involved in cell wall biosynthesis
MSTSNTNEPEPQISVIIRAYNSEATIRDAIESVINQTYRGSIEIIVCYDKGSRDRTYDIITEYSKRKYTNRRVVVIEHEHTTPFIALLKGFENAQGKLITILDADNVFPKTYIEHVMRQINNFSEEKSFYYTNLVVVDERFRPKFVRIQSNVSFERLLLRNLIDMSTMFLERKCLNRILEHLVKISKIRYFEFLYEDYLLSLIAFKLCNPKYIQGVYVIYREHGLNLTGVTSKNVYKQLLSIERSIKTLIAFRHSCSVLMNTKEKLIWLISVLYRVILMVRVILFLVINHCLV